MHKILFIKPSNSSFINIDLKILESIYNVKTFSLNQGGEKKIKYLFRLISMIWFLLQNMKNSKAFVIWFADYDAAVMVLIGKLFRKKTVIFAGGKEAVCYKELGKGVYIKKFRGACVRFALRNATLVLPNHKSLLYHENTYYNAENPHIDGIQHYVPNLRCKIEIIPNGIELDRINRDPAIEKQHNLIFTVGNMNQLVDFYNKGHDIFIDLARRNPDLEFVLINLNPKYLHWVEENFRISEIKNLTAFSTFCNAETLNSYYNRAKVYMQASITEGMPQSVSEAMLCECIPVGSNINGIPDAIGPCGVIVKHRNIEEWDTAVRKALSLDTGKQAREYTIQNYSYPVREKKIKEVFANLLGK